MIEYITLNAVLFVSALVIFYYYLTRNFNYWKSRGIPGPKPYPLVGASLSFFTKVPSESMLEDYNKYGKIFGTFLGSRPILVVSDPELIKDVMIKDFHKFVDRNDFKFGDVLNERSLFNMSGDDWKGMRSVISPTFSSGKMRKMHPTIVDCIDKLEEALVNNVKRGNTELNIKKYMGNLTMDVIATCAFATKIDVYDETKTNEFIVNAQKIFRGNWRFFVFFVCSGIYKNFSKKFRWQLQAPSVANFFKSAIKSIVSQRKANAKYNDYLQLMINAKNKTVDHEEESHENDATEEIYGKINGLEVPKNKLNIKVTDDDITANTFLFLVAGYETTAATLSHLIYSLALNEKCQQKLYEEVKQFDGKYTYETVDRMPYMEACIAETLRLYNPVPGIGRMAGEEYTLGDTGLTIPKGMMIQCNVQALHRNPDYYPSPDRFDPERFMPENKDKLTPYTYMPFGLGPRNCVGMRFALMEAKTAAAYLVNKFRFFRTAKTRVPLRGAIGDFILNTGEVFVGLELRNK